MGAVSVTTEPKRAPMSEPRPPAAVIVLAAGEGTRMRSAPQFAVPKVMRGFAGRSMIGHVLAATAPLDAAQTLVVVGHLRDVLIGHLKEIAPGVETVIQDEQLGTGHAVRIALTAVPAGGDGPSGPIVVVPGDTPLLTPATLAALGEAHARTGAAVTLLTSHAVDPTGYGRIIRTGAGVSAVVEHKDASPEQLAITEVASGVYAFDQAFLREAVGQLSTANAQGEEYLPDVVQIAVRAGRPVHAVVAPADETAGVNDRSQLAQAHRVFNDRLLEAHLLAGVTVIDPATTWVDVTVTIEPDATVRPGVQLHGTTSIAAGAVIGPDTTLTDTAVGARSQLQRVVANQATIGADVTVGPYAYLRPGTVLAEAVHVGTYVEIKGSDIGAGSKVPHLSYVGDASIGEHTNIGAATVFVNYDGVHKHRSVIGSHARTGADNMFVAPVDVGDGAYTAAGSIITEDVPPGAMAIARARQRNLPDWVAQNRAGTAADMAARAARSTADQTDAEGQHS
jgi:bifunctional UDP-N-acetylglucosamine pyrophosphorylase/glucosamine-1-phosphate N-acetyltransferase